jgi:hypothetical protein
MPGAAMSRHADEMSMRRQYLDIIWVQFNRRVGILYSVAILLELYIRLEKRSVDGRV